MVKHLLKPWHQLQIGFTKTWKEMTSMAGTAFLHHISIMFFAYRILTLIHHHQVFFSFYYETVLHRFFYSWQDWNNLIVHSMMQSFNSKHLLNACQVLWTMLGAGVKLVVKKHSLNVEYSIGNVMNYMVMAMYSVRWVLE